MSDGHASWEASVDEPPRRASAGLLAGLGAMVVVLAAAGAVGGWLLAGDGGGRQGLDVNLTPSASPTAQPSHTPTLSPATPTTSPTATRSDGGFRLPDLVGQDFEQARRALRERGLGWRLVFGASGDDRSVERTEPAAGSRLQPGQTVKLIVRGAAPPVVVPILLGRPCKAAAGLLVDRGLYPQYPTGHSGPVRKQDPEPPAELRWNDRVKIYCGPGPIAPTGSGAP
jgi:uncharacterized RDD family membrane protein YckC